MTARRTTRRKAAPTAAPVPAIPTRPMAGGGREHPVLGVGLWALGRWTPEDEARTKACLDRALTRGVTWFDTAEVYGAGRSERLLGDALARHGGLRDRAFIASKVSWEHLAAPMVRSAVIGSLHRLGRPSVELYLVHAPSPHVPIAETMGALETMRADGRIGALGVSNFDATELRDAARALRGGGLAVDQIRMNLLEPDEADAILPVAQDEGVLVEAYTPLARGLLAGRYLDGEAPSASVRSIARDLFDQDRFPVLRERATALAKLAEREGVPLAALALHGIVRRGALPVVGVSRPEQVDALMEAWSARPSDGALDRAVALGRGSGAG